MDRDQILSGRRILVIEDEGLIALDLEYMVEGWGFDVVGSAANVAAALRLAADELPDAALLDANLGGETSGTVAAALQAEDRPFLVLTAYRRGDLTGALLDAPLLCKPVEESKLQRELTLLLADSRRD